jgi:hypothetical protein
MFSAFGLMQCNLSLINSLGTEKIIKYLPYWNGHDFLGTLSNVGENKMFSLAGC